MGKRHLIIAHAGGVAGWISNADRVLRAHWLPVSYPELNPDELMRSGYKARHTKKFTLKEEEAPVPEATKIVYVEEVL